MGAASGLMILFIRVAWTFAHQVSLAFTKSCIKFIRVTVKSLATLNFFRIAPRSGYRDLISGFSFFDESIIMIFSDVHNLRVGVQGSGFGDLGLRIRVHGLEWPR